MKTVPLSFLLDLTTSLISLFLFFLITDGGRESGNGERMEWDISDLCVLNVKAEDNV